jgi:hypothetical protein
MLMTILSCFGKQQILVYHLIIFQQFLQHQQFLLLYLPLFRLPIHKLDLKGPKVQRVLRGQLDPRALQALKVLLERKGHKVLLELREPQVPKEIQDRKVQQALKVQ